jgi:hypothetical protein
MVSNSSTSPHTWIEAVISRKQKLDGSNELDQLLNTSLALVNHYGLKNNMDQFSIQFFLVLDSHLIPNLVSSLFSNSMPLLYPITPRFVRLERAYIYSGN